MSEQEKMELLLFCVFIFGSIITIGYFWWLLGWEKNERSKIEYEKYKSKVMVKDYYKKEKKFDYGKIIRIYLTKHFKK